ncbi:type II toxin-antitoxin system Phd/YefM family antitoxin [bacterium]|nr:type II toxin-antitoxin system Phd/YefM family antitoxin [bacterium]MCI0605391.1 type II toxin-antitoxin system Phd/YefM family antitoxin [bacterium]
MKKKITSTEAVRNFSEILNGVKYKGLRYTVVRGGKPIAEINPVETARIEERTMLELPQILKKIPRLGKESVSFERDLRWVISRQPSPAENGEWE